MLVMAEMIGGILQTNQADKWSQAKQILNQPHWLKTKDEIKLADLGSCRGIYSRQPRLGHLMTAAGVRQ